MSPPPPPKVPLESKIPTFSEEIHTLFGEESQIFDVANNLFTETQTIKNNRDNKLQKMTGIRKPLSKARKTSSNLRQIMLEDMLSISKLMKPIAASPARKF